MHHTHTDPDDPISSPTSDDPISSPTLTAVPIQSPAGTWTYYLPPPVASTSSLSSSKESGSSTSIVGPVVGGGIGGLVLVFLVALVVVRKRKKSKEARKRRLDFLEGRNPVGLFTFGGLDFNCDGTADIGGGGGGGSNSSSGAVAAEGHRRVPHKASSYPTHHQQHRQNQQESDDEDEEQYDPYYAHRQRQQRLQRQVALEYYIALQLHQKQIRGYSPEGLLYQHHQSQHFTPAASAPVPRSCDSPLSLSMAQITAQSSHPAYADPYPQQLPPSATISLRRHSYPWATSSFQHHDQQSIAGIPELGRRVTSFEKGAHNTSIDPPPIRSPHSITENHVKTPMDNASLTTTMLPYPF